MYSVLYTLNLRSIKTSTSHKVSENVSVLSRTENLTSRSRGIVGRSPSGLGLKTTCLGLVPEVLVYIPALYRSLVITVLVADLIFL